MRCDPGAEDPKVLAGRGGARVHFASRAPGARGRDTGCPSGVGEVDAWASVTDAMKPRGGERFVRREDPIGAQAASPIGHSDLLEDRRR